MYIYSNVCKQMIDVKLLLLHSNTCNPLTGSIKNELRLVLKCYKQSVFTNLIYLIYMYK